MKEERDPSLGFRVQGLGFRDYEGGTGSDDPRLFWFGRFGARGSGGIMLQVQAKILFFFVVRGFFEAYLTEPRYCSKGRYLMYHERSC